MTVAPDDSTGAPGTGWMPPPPITDGGGVDDVPDLVVDGGDEWLTVLDGGAPDSF